MKFDFDTFSQIAAKVYKAGNPYTLEQCLTVFRCYFDKYEVTQGHPHPPIRTEQIGRIMRIMPWTALQDIGSPYPDIIPEVYPHLINRHFKTKYRNCDYNVNHFFSGRVRELRLREVVAGYE